MLTRLWQLFRKIFVCFPFHRYANVLKLKDFYTTSTRPHTINSCSWLHQVWLSVQKFTVQTWENQGKKKIHIRNPSTSNKTCFHLGRCSTREVFISESAREHRQNLGSTSSIWLSRCCSNVGKAVPIIDPVFLPESVLFQTSSGFVSPCLPDGF